MLAPGPLRENPMQQAISRSRFSFDSTYAALTLTTLLWSSNFIIGRAFRDDITPSTLNFLRWSIAFAVLLPFTLNDLRAHRAVIARHWKLFALLGLTGIAAFQTLVYMALTMTGALNTVLLLSFAPLAIVGVSWAVLGEPITRGQALGLVTSLCGAAVLVLRGDFAALDTLHFNGGDLLMLLAVIAWTTYSVLLKRRPAEIPPLAVHTLSVGTGTLWMLPLFALQVAHGRGMPASMSAWMAVAFIAIFSSAFAHGLWVRGVAAIGPNRASVFIHLLPLFGGALAIVFLGEQLAAYHIVGAVLVLSGVALASRT